MYFFGVGKFSGYPYRSEILCSFDLCCFYGNPSTPSSRTSVCSCVFRIYPLRTPQEIRCMLWSSKLDRSRLAPYCLRARTLPPFFSTESAFALLPPGGRCRPTKLLSDTEELFCKIVIYTAYEAVFQHNLKRDFIWVRNRGRIHDLI